MMVKLSKEEFVRRYMSDVAKRKRQQRNKVKLAEMDVWGHIFDNHYKIVKRCGYTH